MKPSIFLDAFVILGGLLIAGCVPPADFAERAPVKPLMSERIEPNQSHSTIEPPLPSSQVTLQNAPRESRVTPTWTAGPAAGAAPSGKQPTASNVAEFNSLLPTPPDSPLPTPTDWPPPPSEVPATPTETPSMRPTREPTATPSRTGSPTLTRTPPWTPRPTIWLETATPARPDSPLPTPTWPGSPLPTPPLPGTPRPTPPLPTPPDSPLPTPTWPGSPLPTLPLPRPT